MFDLSKKVDYGLELMISLARNYGQKPLSLKEVSKRKALPVRFLEQIVIPLKEAGLVIGKEGRSGGYSLTLSPTKINLAQVLEALEEPVSLGACSGCPKAVICGQRTVWQEAGNKIRQTMEFKTLADLI